jgi:hypothetical protein
MQIQKYSLLTGLFIAGLIIFSYGILFVLDIEASRVWGTEDGPVEWAGAAALAIAGGAFAWLASMGSLATRSKVWLGLLAALLLFGAGEEISWGQRIFGFETPAMVKDSNLQGETNIHNLVIFHAQDEAGAKKAGIARWFTTHRLFSLFWLGFCLLIPAAYHVSSGLRNLLETLGMPIVNIGLGIFFPVVYISAELLIAEATRRGIDWPLIETKESLYSILFAIVAIELLLKVKRSGNLKRISAAEFMARSRAD